MMRLGSTIAKTASAGPLVSLLQRKCACGAGLGADSKCAMWGTKNGLAGQASFAVGSLGDAHEQEADQIADQVMSTPTRAAGDGAPPRIQRFAGPSGGHDDAVPASVERTLASQGTPLEPALRQDMERRFQHDFSQVRVHADAQAGESAKAVNALAYTVGNHLVFAPAQYSLDTTQGHHLIAHELTHVIQQTHGTRSRSLQRQPSSRRAAAVDANAQRIIDLAQDTSRPVDERAIAVVRAIIDQYYPADASKITRITFRADEPGLHITYAGRGASTTGQIEVGRYFVENTVQAHFARRVSQVRHEIEHVEQQRSGMSGESRQDEREFIAFYHEALFQEPSGTGRMQHSTRVNLIDAALGYYHCLSEDLQRANTTRRDELVARRSEAVRRSGRSDLGEAPTGCRRQRD